MNKTRLKNAMIGFVGVSTILFQAAIAGDVTPPKKLAAFECEMVCDEEHSACWKKCLEGPIEKNRSCHDACNATYRSCTKECTSSSDASTIMPSNKLTAYGSD